MNDRWFRQKLELKLLYKEGIITITKPPQLWVNTLGVVAFLWTPKSHLALVVFWLSSYQSHRLSVCMAMLVSLLHSLSLRWVSLLLNELSKCQILGFVILQWWLMHYTCNEELVMALWQKELLRNWSHNPGIPEVLSRELLFISISLSQYLS